MMQKLELPMYTVRDAETIAGIPKNMGYKYIRTGDLEAVKDEYGQWRVPYESLVHFVMRRA